MREHRVVRTITAVSQLGTRIVSQPAPDLERTNPATHSCSAGSTARPERAARRLRTSIVRPFRSVAGVEPRTSLAAVPSHADRKKNRTDGRVLRTSAEELHIAGRPQADARVGESAPCICREAVADAGTEATRSPGTACSTPATPSPSNDATPPAWPATASGGSRSPNAAQASCGSAGPCSHQGVPALGLATCRAGSIPRFAALPRPDPGRIRRSSWGRIRQLVLSSDLSTAELDRTWPTPSRLGPAACALT